MKWAAGPSDGMQCSGATRAAMHHGAKKSACMNTPPVKCATLKTSDNASIKAVLPKPGVLVMSSGGPAIDPCPPADLQIAASSRSVRPCHRHATSPKETENERDRK